MGCLSAASFLTTVSSNLSAVRAGAVTGTEAPAPPRAPPQAAPFPRGGLPVHRPQSVEVLDHAVLLKARFECKQKRFPEGTKNNSQTLLKWVIVMQHVKVSLEDLLKPRKKKGGLVDSTYYGPDVLLLESHSSALQSCCLDTMTLSVL